MPVAYSGDKRTSYERSRSRRSCRHIPRFSRSASGLWKDGTNVAARIGNSAFAKRAACVCDQKINFSLKVDLGATAESSRCRSSTRRGSTVSLGFGVASRQRPSARRRRRKGRWNLAPPREKTPPPPPPLTTTMSEIEVEEGEDDSGRSTAAQGRDNIEWWRLLMTRPEAPPAVTEEEAARRAERRPSPLDRIEQRTKEHL